MRDQRIHHKGRFRLALLNIQGLTDVKAAEITEIMERDRVDGDIVLFGLVETHEKYRKINWTDNIILINKMRTLEDKKGGGLMLLTNTRDEMLMEEIECNNNDILVAEVELFKRSLFVILVYADTKDRDRNQKLYRELNCIMQKLPQEAPRVIFGDFNGHIGFLGPQAPNSNGEMMLDFMEEWNLSLLNADDRCEGMFTRIQGENKSVIDYVMVNEIMHRMFRNMIIDENKEIFDTSDHCLVSAWFETVGSMEVKQCKWEEKEYLNVKDGTLMHEFVGRVESELVDKSNINMAEFDDIIGKHAKDCLTKRVRIRKDKSNKIAEPSWMNNNIRDEIKYRRELNRKKRRSEGEERDRISELYIQQKAAVKILVRDEKSKYEKAIAQEIKANDNPKKMWDMIKKMRGENTVPNRKKLYKGNEEVTESEEANEMINYWISVYQINQNGIAEGWNERKRELYIQQRNNEIEEFEAAAARRENSLGMLRIGRVGGVARWMEDIVFNREDIKKWLKRIKNGKQPGPDGIKGEIYRSLSSSDVCINSLLMAFNNVLGNGQVPCSWKASRTVMIPKERKPEARQHRPIALTNISYKVFMGMVRDRLAGQRMSDERVSDLQAGFSEGRRLEDNLFLLEQCVEDCYRTKKELFMIAVDFSKAFDSVSRRALVEALMYYKCEPKLIEVIVSLYTGDKTTMSREGKQLGDVEVLNGIRQGCTGSPQLFVMVVGRIIEELVRSGMGYTIRGIRVPVLFYADDGLILAETREMAQEMFKILESKAAQYGLHVNRDKSACMIYGNNDTGDESVAGIKTVSKMKYLGVSLTIGKDCFKENRGEKIKLAERMANITYSVVARSCERLLMGKTFWKSIVLPAVLSSGQLMVWSKKEMEKLQRIENSVWRKIMSAPTYTPVCTLQGEIGSSSVLARDIKGKLRMAKYFMSTENKILRNVFERVRGSNSKWMKRMDEYLQMMNLQWEDIRTIETAQIVKRVNEWERQRWREEVQNKSTLTFYKLKDNIGGEVCYDNSWGSRLLFGMRSNTLRLGWRARFSGGDVTCQMCRLEEETLEHFIAECGYFADIREEFGITNMENAMGFGEGHLDRHKIFLERMWKRRVAVVGEGTRA